MQRKKLNYRLWQSACDWYGSQLQIEGLAYNKPIGTAPSVARIISALGQENG